MIKITKLKLDACLVAEHKFSVHIEFGSEAQAERASIPHLIRTGKVFTGIVDRAQRIEAFKYLYYNFGSFANEPENQSIKDEFVGKHVFCNLTQFVEFSLVRECEDSPILWEDVENLYTQKVLEDQYRTEYNSRDNETTLFIATNDGEEEVKTKTGKHDIWDFDEVPYDAQEYEEGEPETEEGEHKEIFEWWAVSDYLMRQLKKMGEPVADVWPCIWGRTTTGQAILLDYEISQICINMGILVGLDNSWGKEDQSR